MNIEFVVIHEILKNEKSTGARLALSDAFADETNDQITSIITALDSSFTKKTLKRAKFSEDGFKPYIPKFGKATFLELSKTLTEKLKDGLQNIPAAKGGYLIFCNYTTTKNFLSVFWVRDTKGSLLSYKDAEKIWNINSTEYLDVDHFAMGVKINLDILNSSSDDRYISLVKGNTDISEYFLNWIGLDDAKQETKDGDALYELSNKIFLPNGINRQELKKNIFEFAKNKPSKIVNLKELSLYIYGNEDTIRDFCENENIDIDGEFKLTAKQLNRFHKIHVKAGGIELSAPRSSFSSDGIDVTEDGETVLIRSKELAQEIIKNLEMQKKNND